MNFDEYSAIDAINWSRLRSMKASPLQYQHDLKATRKTTAAMSLGTAIHTMVLEPEHFHDRHPVWDGGARRGKEWAGFKELHEGKQILTAAEAWQAGSAGQAVLQNPLAKPYLSGDTHVESVLEWDDEETGLKCKARADLISGPCLVELKSSKAVEPEEFRKTAARMSYHGQLAFYYDGARECGYPLTEAVVIAVASAEPHDVVVYLVPEEVLDAGRRLYRRLLTKLWDCMEKEEWPGAGPEPMELWLPAWADEMADDSVPITIGGEQV